MAAVILEWWKKVDKVGLGVLVAALAVFVPFCGAYGLWDPWETHYGEAARQIIVRGDWWTLYWEDDYFFSKPILLFWLMALSFKVLGVSEVAARLPVVLCAVAGVYSVYWGVSAVYRSRRAGALAAAAVASIPLYAFIARQCITDMPFVASMTIALMAMARYEFSPGPRRPRYMYMFYVFCGLATLAKGPLGLLLPGAVVLSYLIVSWDWGFLRRARIPTGVVVFLCVAAPWYLAMVVMHGERFINEFFIYNNVQRATGTGVHGAHLDFWYYVRRADPRSSESGGPVLQAGTFPWLALFPAAAFTYLVHHVVQLGRSLRAKASGDDEAAKGRLRLALLLLCWAVVSFAVFSYIPTKFHHYLLPLAPPVAAIAALWLFDAAAGRVNKMAAAAGLLLAAGIVVYIARLLGEEPWDTLNLFIYQYGRADLRRFEVGDVYLYFGYAMTAALVVAAFFRRYLFYAASALATLALALAVYGIDVYMPMATDCVSQADAFRHYDAERRPGDQLINWQMNYRGEVFYGRSQATKAVSDTHLRWLLSRTKRSFIVANRGVFGHLAPTLRRITGQDPRVLNPATCNTRMILYDGPHVAAPTFRPSPELLVDQVPSTAHRPDETIRIGPDVSLAGYRVEWIGSGNDLTADITLYLRCEQETDEWWKVFVHGESPVLPGRRAISDHIAGGDAFPSVAWHPGDIVVDHTRLRVGWILEAIGNEGDLTINVGLFHDMTRAQVTPESAQDGENRVVVARYDPRAVPADAVLSELPADVEPLETPVELRGVATLLAKQVTLQGRGRQSLAEVVLYLRADERTSEPWQIFLHAQGPSGHRAVSDHHPLSGRVRTTEWEPNRIYVDRTSLDLGRMQRGTVRIYGGMFNGNQRAEVSPAEASDGDRRIVLGELERR